MKGDFIESQHMFPLPSAEGTDEHVSCPKLDRTSERFWSNSGSYGSERGRQLCLLGFRTQRIS